MTPRQIEHEALYEKYQSIFKRESLLKYIASGEIYDIPTITSGFTAAIQMLIEHAKIIKEHTEKTMSNSFVRTADGEHLKKIAELLMTPKEMKEFEEKTADEIRSELVANITANATGNRRESPLGCP